MLGMGKGRITIKLEKFNFNVGDTINGVVSLDLKKPVNARELSISLRGDRKGSMSKDDQGGQRLYDFEVHLDGEKEYTKGMEYPFEIVIPQDVANLKPGMPDVGGKLGSALKVAQGAAAMMGKLSQLKWYLHAKLDVPKGIDVKDNQDITIQ